MPTDVHRQTLHENVQNYFTHVGRTDMMLPVVSKCYHVKCTYFDRVAPNSKFNVVCDIKRDKDKVTISKL